MINFSFQITRSYGITLSILVTSILIAAGQQVVTNSLSTFGLDQYLDSFVSLSYFSGCNSNILLLSPLLIDTNLFAETVRPNDSFRDLECSFLKSLYFRFSSGFVSQWNSVSFQTFQELWSDILLKYTKTEIWIRIKYSPEVHLFFFFFGN